MIVDFLYIYVTRFNIGWLLLLGPFDCCLSLLFTTNFVFVGLNKKFESTTSGGMSKFIIVSIVSTKWDIEKLSNDNDIEL